MTYEYTKKNKKNAYLVPKDNSNITGETECIECPVDYISNNTANSCTICSIWT